MEMYSLKKYQCGYIRIELILMHLKKKRSHKKN